MAAVQASVRSDGNRIREIRRQITGFSFTLPAVVLLAIFLLYPIGYVLWLSFQKWNLLGAPAFVGFKNYETILWGTLSSDFYKSVGVSIFFSVLAVPAQVGLGLFLAVLLEKKLRGRAFYRSAFFLPMVVSFVAAGIAFTWLFQNLNQPGFVPAMLAKVGIGFPKWQLDGFAAMFVVVLMNTWKVAGFSMILYLAGLQGVPGELYEAAEIDGVRTGWQRFRHISWPLIVPTTTLLVITNTIGSLQAFVPFYVMTNGGPAGDTTSIVYFLYNMYASQTGVASAGASIFLIFVLAITAVQLTLTRRAESIY
jgi:multiple sugar transport system permease protein